MQFPDDYTAPYRLASLASGADHDRQCDCAQCEQARDRLANLLESRMDVDRLRKEWRQGR